MRRFAPFVIVAGVLLAPATPAYGHGGDAPDATAYRTTITGISTPEKGLSVRTVEAGARLELTNHTGHSVEVLGYAGEPYLDVRPDGTYQNVNSPAAYLNATLSGESPVPSSADPTAVPAWRKISAATTVRWHDERTHWLSPGRPAAATADPGRTHRLRAWQVPLREQTRVFAITGTLDWVPPPRAGLWWLGAALAGLAAIGLAYRWPGTVRPLTLIAGLSPLTYAALRAADGGTPPLVLLPVGLLALAAAWRHPPFVLALTGTAVTIFAGASEANAFHAAILPTAGPGGLTRTLILTAASLGTALAATGLRTLRRFPAVEAAADARGLGGGAWPAKSDPVGGLSSSS